MYIYLHNFQILHQSRYYFPKKIPKFELRQKNTDHGKNGKFNDKKKALLPAIWRLVAAP